MDRKKVERILEKNRGGLDKTSLRKLILWQRTAIHALGESWKEEEAKGKRCLGALVDAYIATLTSEATLVKTLGELLDTVVDGEGSPKTLDTIVEIQNTLAMIKRVMRGGRADGAKE